MLKECVDVFRHKLSEEGERLILDSYIPVDGTYLIIDRDGNQKAAIDMKLDKKTRTVDKSSQFFPDICFYDYHSQLLSMNKPVDGKKLIHSNNYLSFWIKKDSLVSGKLTEEIIDGYYETLKNPVEQKYKKSKEATNIYNLFCQVAGEVDQEILERNKAWIKEHIHSLDEVDISKKGYLKIFFEAPREEFEKEGRRYYLPNIYNSNDYNIEIEGTVYGLPDNNLGMNAKKPYLALKSRKCSSPHLLNGEDVMIQKKFFDYLMNFASIGCCNVYVDTGHMEISAYPNGEAPQAVDSGYYLRIKKGKTEAEILDQDNIPGYRQQLAEPIHFKNYVDAKHEKHPEYHDKYLLYDKRVQVGQLIDEVFFSKCLGGNYFTKAGDMSITNEIMKQNILLSRDVIFSWAYKGIDQNFAKVMDQTSLNMIKGTLMSGYRDRALLQMNLRFSLQEYFSKKGEGDMAEIISNLRAVMEEKILSKETIPLEDDKEYYYAVGQFIAYLTSLSKAKDKNQSVINPFLNARTDEMLKKRILQLYKKYNYSISEYSKRVKNLLTMIEGYVPDGKLNQEMLMLGYASDNLIYTKEEGK